MPFPRHLFCLICLIGDKIADGCSAARALGPQIIVLECRAVSDFETAFVTMVERQARGLVVSAFPLAFNNRIKILTLAAHHKIPTIYPQNQYAYGDGLMSYSSVGAFRQVAVRYVAPILKGTKPADLPIEQPTNFKLIINLKTAKALGLHRATRFVGARRRGDRMKAGHHCRARQRGGLAAGGAGAVA